MYVGESSPGHAALLTLLLAVPVRRAKATLMRPKITFLVHLFSFPAAIWSISSALATPTGLALLESATIV
jgi:hypothetical protein